MTGAEIIVAREIIEAVLPPLVDGIVWVAGHCHYESAESAIKRLATDAKEDSDWLCANLVERVECDTKKKGWKRQINMGTAARAGSPALVKAWLEVLMPMDKVLLIELEQIQEEEKPKNKDRDKQS